MLDGIWSLDEAFDLRPSDASRGAVDDRLALPGSAAARTRYGFSATATPPDGTPLAPLQVDPIEEVIAAADAAGMAMVFTGHRHFRH